MGGKGIIVGMSTALALPSLSKGACWSTLLLGILCYDEIGCVVRLGSCENVIDRV